MQNTSICLTPEKIDIKAGDDFNISSNLTGADEGNITYFDNGEVLIGTVFSCKNLSAGKHHLSTSLYY